MISKTKAIEEIINTYTRLRNEKENIIKTHKNRLIELQKAIDILYKNSKECHDLTKTQQQLVNNDHESANTATVDHHMSDPLKMFKRKTRRTYLAKEKRSETHQKTEGLKIQGLIEPVYEFDEDFLENSQCLSYNTRDYIEESLLELTNIESQHSNIQCDREILKQAKLIFEQIDSKSLKACDIADKSKALFKSGDIPRTKCTQHFESILHNDISKLQNLKSLAEKGGSRRSGRTQKDIMFERIRNSKLALALWSKLQFNAKLYTLSHYVFAYHDTLKIYRKQIRQAMKEKEDILEFVTNRLKNEKPLTGCEITQLTGLIKCYSNRMEHISGFKYRFMLTPELNEWIYDGTIQKQLNLEHDTTELVKEIKSYRQKIESSKSLNDDYELKINEYNDRIERTEEYIKKLESSKNADHVILREHQSLRHYEKEIEALRHSIDGPRHQMMDMEMQLFKATLASIKDLVNKDQESDDNRNIHNMSTCITPWAYSLAEQVTRLLTT